MTDNELQHYREEVDHWIAEGRPSRWPISQSEGRIMRETERWLATVDALSEKVARCAETVSRRTRTRSAA